MKITEAVPFPPSLHNATEIGHKYNFLSTEQMFKMGKHKRTGQIHKTISQLPTGQI